MLVRIVSNRGCGYAFLFFVFLQEDETFLDLIKYIRKTISAIINCFLQRYQLMLEDKNYDSLSFTLAGRYFEGRQVARGIALGIGLTSVYWLRRFFTGGWCHIDKDLTGKNVVITGGNAGIGKQTARRLVELGANVIIGSRDEKKNQETVFELMKIKRGKITCYKLDLSDKQSIEGFVANVKRDLIGEPLHYLVNNAGLITTELKLTKQNLQMQIGVNHFGHFYLTHLLWDKLKQSITPRIINVSSLAHRSMSKSQDIDFSNINFQNGGYNSFAAYSHSKKANILFTKELQRKMINQKINGVVVSLHPGAVRTSFSDNYVNTWWKKIIMVLFYPLVLFTFKNNKQGAQTTLYCLLEDDNKLIKGGYYADCKLAQTKSPQVEDREAAQRLWLQSQRAFGIRFQV